MTTYRQYRCNLCKDFIKPTEDTPREGFGVHFHAYAPQQITTSRPQAGQWLSFKRASECENHICLACARAVHDELRKVTPAEQTQGPASTHDAAQL